MVWLSLLPAVTGCLARRMVDQYLSFDAAVTSLYEKHVLYNLAQRDTGGTMVQMSYSTFSGTLTDTLSTSGQIAFFANPQTTGRNGTTVSVNSWQQVFQPTVSSSIAAGLTISGAPSDNQEIIRALYDEQIARQPASRIFRHTRNMTDATRSYCWIRVPNGELYYVPSEKHREFADFVHKVSFCRPTPPPCAMPAIAPASQPVTMR